MWLLITIKEKNQITKNLDVSWAAVNTYCTRIVLCRKPNIAIIEFIFTVDAWFTQG